MSIHIGDILIFMYACIIHKKLWISRNIYDHIFQFRSTYSSAYIYQWFSCHSDVGPLLEKSDDPKMAEDEGVLKVVRQLDKACKEAGFFYVVLPFNVLLHVNNLEFAVY